MNCSSLPMEHAFTKELVRTCEKCWMTHMTLILNSPNINIAIYAGSPNTPVRRSNAAPNSACKNKKTQNVKEYQIKQSIAMVP
jgi:hypothetical protein